MREKFPNDFVFGVADADLQVIGEAKARSAEHSEETMWSYFARESGKCHANAGPDVGVDRFNLWQDDIALMRELGVKHYRTSVSMARLLHRNGEINASAARWYGSYFNELRNAGIKVYATLYHWELPQFLNEQGGWKNRAMADWLVRHAEAVFQTLGEYIEEYFILNEPWCSSFLSYHLGIHAPGEHDLASALLAAHNLLLAQGAVFSQLKELDPNLKVSTVLNLSPVYASSPSREDARAARAAEVYFNSWFLEPMFNGSYPDEGLDVFGDKVPHFSKTDLTTINIGSKLSALGINYYRGATVRWDQQADVKFSPAEVSGHLSTDLGWPIYVPPIYRDGLYDLLQQLWFTYRKSGLKKLYITENGMAEKSAPVNVSGVIPDDRRLNYLKAHIEQVAAAVTSGVPVEAYFLWTLMDNYEWAEGYRPESAFGTVHVDRSTLQRTKKKSAVWYSKLL